MMTSLKLNRAETRHNITTYTYFYTHLGRPLPSSITSTSIGYDYSCSRNQSNYQRASLSTK